MVLSLGSSGRRKNHLALICLVWKWKMPLDHLWLNAEFHTRMCGKDSYSSGRKEGASGCCGKATAWKGAPHSDGSRAQGHAFAEDVHWHIFFLPFSSFWPLPEAFAPVHSLGPSIGNYLLLSCLFMALSNYRFSFPVEICLLLSEELPSLHRVQHDRNITGTWWPLFIISVPTP